jgi:hypothetical protein
MKVLSKGDKKLIEKYKKNVHKQYPGAYLVALGSGYYTIMQEQDDLSRKDILAEYYFVPVKDPVKAWELAQVSSKTTQNFNRTHPIRIDAMDAKDKAARIEKRRVHITDDMKHIKKNESKRKDWDNYL